MKKLLYTISLALLFSFGWLHAQSIMVSGTVTDSLNGSPIPNYIVQLDVYDTTNMLTTSGTMLTDSMGQYNFAVTTVNGPFVGWFDVYVYDCNGALNSLHFGYLGGNAFHNGVDFQICAAPASCNAAFTASTIPGNPAVSFSNLSTTNSGSVVSWNWDFGDQNTGTGPNPSHTYASTGTYQVCLTIATSNGCTSTFCDSVTAGAAQSNCTASLTYTQLPSGAFGFVVTASGTGVPVQYFYDFADGNVLTSPYDTVTHSYPNGGTMQPCVTVLFSDSCVATACTTVFAGIFCQALFYAVPDTTGQYSLLLVNNSFGTNLVYSWSFGDGGTSTLAYPQHTYAGVGTYAICLDITDTVSSCFSNFCDSITVTQKQLAAFTIQVVPPGGLTGATTPSPDPISDLSIYPNPVGETLNLKLTLEQRSMVNVRLMDLNGRIVKSVDGGIKAAGMQDLKMDVREIPAGLYLLQVDANGTTTRRVAVVH
ncbi:MAG: PKD domain-containing protein [Bacteroidia bacterium]